MLRTREWGASDGLNEAFKIYRKQLERGNLIVYALVEGLAVEYGVEGDFHSLAKKHDIPRPTRQDINAALSVSSAI